MVSAMIADRWGNPLADHTLVMTVSGSASVQGGTDTQETDEYGEASGFVFQAGMAEDVVITIEDQDARGGIFMTTSVTVE